MTDRSKDGTFKPGKSGNPSGRPKGVKNQITLIKESLELLLREQGSARMPEVLEKAFELALEGDRSMIKLLLELHMSKGTSQETGKAIEKVEIKVSGPSKAVKEEAPVVDYEPEFTNTEVH